MGEKVIVLKENFVLSVYINPNPLDTGKKGGGTSGVLLQLL